MYALKHHTFLRQLLFFVYLVVHNRIMYLLNCHNVALFLVLQVSMTLPLCKECGLRDLPCSRTFHCPFCKNWIVSKLAVSSQTTSARVANIKQYVMVGAVRPSLLDPPTNWWGLGRRPPTNTYSSRVTCDPQPWLLVAERTSILPTRRSVSTLLICSLPYRTPRFWRGSCMLKTSSLLQYAMPLIIRCTRDARGPRTCWQLWIHGL